MPPRSRLNTKYANCKNCHNLTLSFESGARNSKGRGRDALVKIPDSFPPPRSLGQHRSTQRKVPRGRGVASLPRNSVRILSNVPISLGSLSIAVAAVLPSKLDNIGRDDVLSLAPGVGGLKTEQVKRAGSSSRQAYDGSRVCWCVGGAVRAGPRARPSAPSQICSGIGHAREPVLTGQAA